MAMEISTIKKWIVMLAVIALVLVVIIFGAWKIFMPVGSELNVFTTACYKWTQTYCKTPDASGIVTIVDKNGNPTGDTIDMLAACNQKFGTSHSASQAAAITNFWTDCKKQCMGCPV